MIFCLRSLSRVGFSTGLGSGFGLESKDGVSTDSEVFLGEIST